ncbi:MAG: branched-chain amino acid ABC transporter substrate-binding protein [Burkholderiaceae bacterium]
MKFQTTLMCMALAAGFAAMAPAQADDEVVKIGHVAPITGNIAHLGKDNENGARLAIDDLNSKGFTIGGKKVKFELVPEDDAADPKQGTAAAQKLVDEKVNGVVGHLNSGTTIPASKIYFDAGIPQISPSATNPKYTQQGFKTAFRVVANDGQLGGTLGRYAVNTLHAKTIAVVSDKTAYGDGVANEFKKSAEKAGATIVDTEYTTNSATDFQAILTTIKGKKPDLIFYGGMDAQAGPLIRQMKQLGISAKVAGGDGICTPELAKLAGDGMGDDQVYCAEAGGVGPDKEKGMDDFKARFKAKFGTEVEIYAPYTYDAVMVMADAMKKAGSADPAKYLPFLAKEDYNGVTGHITFDEFGDIKDGSLTLYTYKGGNRDRLAVVK